MGLISRTEASYILQGFQDGIRNDGRTTLQIRPITLQTGVLQQSSGSARCAIGYTEVLVSVKADIGIPFPEEPDLGNIECNVAISPCAMKGMAGETMAEELGVMLERSLKWQKVGPGSALDLSALKIVSGKRCWVLQVDGLVLSTDGNLLGALSIATKAALADLKIPKIDVTMGEDGDDPELDLDDDPELAASIDTSRIPIFISVAQGGLANVVDLTGDEELACPNAAHIAINTKGSVCNVTKTGSEPLAPGRLLDMIDAARGLAPEVHRAMNNYFKSMQ